MLLFHRLRLEGSAGVFEQSGGDLPAVQRLIYDELPPSFETRQGVEIAAVYGMPERSFKRWMATSYFKKVSYGFYEKRFR